MRHCKSRRHPYQRYTRETIQEARTELRTGRERGPRGSRLLITGRSGRATKGEVINVKRAKWRNWDFCMSRVCNSQYHW